MPIPPLGVPASLEMPIRSAGYTRPPLGVPADLQSAVKKSPNLFMLWWICYPQQPGSSRHIDGIGGLQIPRLNRSNLFYDGLQIRRDA